MRSEGCLGTNMAFWWYLGKMGCSVNGAVLCCAVLWCAGLWCAVLWCAVLWRFCGVVLYCLVPCGVVQCVVVRCHVVHTCAHPGPPLILSPNSGSATLRSVDSGNKGWEQKDTASKHNVGCQGAARNTRNKLKRSPTRAGAQEINQRQDARRWYHWTGSDMHVLRGVCALRVLADACLACLGHIACVAAGLPEGAPVCTRTPVHCATRTVAAIVSRGINVPLSPPPRPPQSTAANHSGVMPTPPPPPPTTTAPTAPTHSGGAPPQTYPSAYHRKHRQTKRATLLHL